MKKNVTLSILVWLFISGLDAQTYVNLKLRLINPVEHSVISTMKSFPAKAMITNIGATPLTTNDSLALYLITDNDSFLFFNAGHIDNFALFSNVAINVNDSYLLTLNMAFTQSLAGRDIEFCLMVKPLNRKTKAIRDTLLQDNKGCAFVHIVQNTGLKDQSVYPSQMVLFPNPAMDNFFIPPGIGQIEELCITDLSGKVIPGTLDPEGKVNCAGWEQGFYIVTVRTSDGLYWQKLNISGH